MGIRAIQALWLFLAFTTSALSNPALECFREGKALSQDSHTTSEDLEQYVRRRSRESREHGLMFFFKKGEGTPCGHGVTIVRRNGTDYLPGFSHDGKNLQASADETNTPTIAIENAFRIPMEAEVLSLTSSRVAKLAEVGLHDDAVLLIVRSRDGALRVVDLQSNLTTWIPGHSPSK